METLTVGRRVVIQSGWGGHGGMCGQDFKRFDGNTVATVTDLASAGKVYVKPDNSPYKWRVEVRSLEVL